jgi:methylenetetrahydrofolate reductase (NADPH)
MKVTSTIELSSKPILSLEILPPSRGERISEIFKSVDPLIDYNPSFINITNHQPSYRFIEMNGGVRKIPNNKKTGTIGVAVAIKHRFGVEPVPHIICGGLNKFQLEDLLIELQYLEVKNLFVVRGDPVPGSRGFIGEKDGFEHADEIVKQIVNMNDGKYLYPVKEGVKSEFCIGVAGYPEKHYEAMNLEVDLDHLKQKVKAGADFVITQMFFNVDYYKRFVREARKMGVTIPIIPGIKPIIRERFLKTIPRAFFIDIPSELVKSFAEASTPKEEFKAGTDYMTKVIRELIDFGVPGIHLFTMGKGKSAKAILERFPNVFGHDEMEGLIGIS